MTDNTERNMKAAAINKFGGADEIIIQQLPVPEIADNEVLVKVEYAGIGSWDPFEREGGYAEMQGVEPTFPYVLGSEGAGKVVAVGSGVTGFAEGDTVYASAFLNPKGGFYAEYVAVDASLVSHIPDPLSIEQASGALGVGVTALRGLEDTLKLKAGESLLIFGASGPMGYAAVQLAKKMGVKVFGVASGPDGVGLVKRAGADEAADGHTDSVVEAAQAFCPEGYDAAFLTAGGEVVGRLLELVRDGGRVAYPSGIFPEPEQSDKFELLNYNGEPDQEIIDRFNRLISDGGYDVQVAKTFTLEEAADAQRALDEHHNGKMIIKVA